MRKRTIKRVLVASLATSLAATSTPIQPVPNVYAAKALAVQNTIKPQSIVLNYGTATIKKGASKVLKAVIKPSSATNKAVIWTSSNEKIVKVKDGKLTAVQNGKATITATIKGTNLKTSCKVTVGQIVNRLTITKPAALEVGKSVKLKIKFTPSNVSNKKLIYTSSNKDVATVSTNGTVKALKAGSTTITVKATDGSDKKASVTVTVKEPAVLTITKKSLVNNRLTIRNHTYEKVIIDQSVGSKAKITLSNVTIKDSLSMEDGASYEVAVLDSDIKVIKQGSEAALSKQAVGDTETIFPSLFIQKNSKIGSIIFKETKGFSIKNDKSSTIGLIQVIHKTKESISGRISQYEGKLDIQPAKDAVLKLILENSEIKNAVVSGGKPGQKIYISSDNKTTIQKIEVKQNDIVIETDEKTKITAVKVTADGFKITGSGAVGSVTSNKKDTVIKTKNTTIIDAVTGETSNSSEYKDDVYDRTDNTIISGAENSENWEDSGGSTGDSGNSTDNTNKVLMLVLEKYKGAYSADAVKKIIENANYIEVLGIDLKEYNALEELYQNGVLQTLVDMEGRKDLIINEETLDEVKTNFQNLWKQAVSEQQQNKNDSTVEGQLQTVADYLDNLMKEQADPSSFIITTASDLSLITGYDQFPNIRIKWSATKAEDNEAEGGSISTGEDTLGQVTRPEYADGKDASFLLTAVIQGENEKPAITKEYKVIVLKQEISALQSLIEQINITETQEDILALLTNHMEDFHISFDAYYELGEEGIYQAEVLQKILSLPELSTHLSTIEKSIHTVKTAFENEVAVQAANKIRDISNGVLEEASKEVEALFENGIEISSDTLGLLTTAASGTAITWSSSSELVTIDGDKANITKPLYSNGNQEVILTALLTNGEETTTVVKSVILLCDDPIEAQIAIEAVKTAATAEEIEAILNNEGYMSAIGIDNKAYKELGQPYQNEIGQAIKEWGARKSFGIVIGESLEASKYSFKAKYAEEYEKQYNIKNDTDTTTNIAEIKKELEIGFASGETNTTVKSNLVLLTKLKGADIVWEITEKEEETTGSIEPDGTVVRPLFTVGKDDSFIITATITLGKATETKEFEVTVIKQEEGSLQAAIEGINKAGTIAEIYNLLKANRDLLKLIFDAYDALGKEGTYQEDVLKKVLSLEELSVDLEEIDASAAVIKKTFDDETAVQTAKKNDADAVSEVQKIADALTITFTGDDNAQNVTSDIELLSTSGKSTVTWKIERADDTKTGDISAKGIVTRPLYADGQDAQFKLTATVTLEGKTAEKIFNLTVLKAEVSVLQHMIEEINEEVSPAAMLTLLDTYKDQLYLNWTNYVLLEGDSYKEAVGKKVVDLEKQSLQLEDLTKSINAIKATFDEEVEAQLKKQTDIEADEKLKDIYDSLDIGYAPNENAANVTQDIMLLTNLKGGIIEWSVTRADDVTTGNLSDKGIVTRPVYADHKDANFTLTATIIFGTKTTEKTFTVTVLKAQRNDLQRAIDTLKTAENKEEIGTALFGDASLVKALDLDITVYNDAFNEQGKALVLDALFTMPEKENLSIDLGELETSKASVQKVFADSIKKVISVGVTIEEITMALKTIDDESDPNTLLKKFKNTLEQYIKHENYSAHEVALAKDSYNNLDTSLQAVRMGLYTINTSEIYADLDKHLATVKDAYGTDKNADSYAKSVRARVKTLKDVIGTLDVLMVVDGLTLDTIKGENVSIIDGELLIGAADDIVLPETAVWAERDDITILWSSSNDKLIKTKINQDGEIVRVCEVNKVLYHDNADTEDLLGINDKDDKTPVTLTAELRSAEGGEIRTVSLTVKVKEAQSDKAWLLGTQKGQLKDAQEQAVDQYDGSNAQAVKQVTSIGGVANTTSVKNLLNGIMVSKGASVSLTDNTDNLTAVKTTDWTRNTDGNWTEGTTEIQVETGMVLRVDHTYTLIVTSEDGKTTKEYGLTVAPKVFDTPDLIQTFYGKEFVNGVRTDIQMEESQDSTSKKQQYNVTVTADSTLETVSRQKDGNGVTGKWIGMLVDLSGCVEDLTTVTYNGTAFTKADMEEALANGAGNEQTFLLWMSADDADKASIKGNGIEVKKNTISTLTFQDGETLQLNLTYQAAELTIAKQYTAEANAILSQEGYADFIGEFDANSKKYTVAYQKENTIISKLSLASNVRGSLIQGEAVDEEGKGTLPVKITWKTLETDKTAFINKDGIITRPTYVEGNQEIQLQATITSEKIPDLTTTVLYTVIVEKTAASDKQLAIERINHTKTVADMLDLLNAKEEGSVRSILGLDMETFDALYTAENGKSNYKTKVAQALLNAKTQEEFSIVLDKIGTPTTADSSIKKIQDIIHSAVEEQGNVILEQLKKIIAQDGALRWEGIRGTKNTETTAAEDSSSKEEARIFTVTGNLIGDLALNTSVTDNEGVVVAWSVENTENAKYLNVSDALGTITRPYYTEKHKEIILKATVTKGAETVTSIYTFTIEQQKADKLQKAIERINQVKETPELSAPAAVKAILEDAAEKVAETLGINIKDNYAKLSDERKQAIALAVWNNGEEYALELKTQNDTINTETAQAEIKEKFNQAVLEQTQEVSTELQATLDALTWSVMKQENENAVEDGVNITGVTTALKLPIGAQEILDTLPDDIVISWKAESDYKVRSLIQASAEGEADLGTVTRPYYTDGDQTVHLTASFQKAPAEDITKTFIITITKEEATDGQIAVEMIKNATAGAPVDLTTLLGKLVNEAALTQEQQNIVLGFEEAQQANLVETLLENGKKYSAELKVQNPTNNVETSIASIQKIVEAYIIVVDAMKDYELVLNQESDTYNFADKVTSNVDQTKEIGITWETQNVNSDTYGTPFINTVGKVTHPAYVEGDQECIVTASFKYDGVTFKKQFTENIKCIGATDLQKAIEAFNTLDQTTTLEAFEAFLNKTAEDTAGNITSYPELLGLNLEASLGSDKAVVYGYHNLPSKVDNALGKIASKEAFITNLMTEKQPYSLAIADCDESKKAIQQRFKENITTQINTIKADAQAKLNAYQVDNGITLDELDTKSTVRKNITYETEVQPYTIEFVIDQAAGKTWVTDKKNGTLEVIRPEFEASDANITITPKTTVNLSGDIAPELQLTLRSENPVQITVKEKTATKEQLAVKAFGQLVKNKITKESYDTFLKTTVKPEIGAEITFEKVLQLDEIKTDKNQYGYAIFKEASQQKVCTNMQQAAENIANYPYDGENIQNTIVIIKDLLKTALTTEETDLQEKLDALKQQIKTDETNHQINTQLLYITEELPTPNKESVDGVLMIEKDFGLQARIQDNTEQRKILYTLTYSVSDSFQDVVELEPVKDADGIILYYKVIMKRPLYTDKDVKGMIQLETIALDNINNHCDITAQELNFTVPKKEATKEQKALQTINELEDIAGGKTAMEQLIDLIDSTTEFDTGNTFSEILGFDLKETSAYYAIKTYGKNANNTNDYVTALAAALMNAKTNSGFDLVLKTVDGVTMPQGLSVINNAFQTNTDVQAEELLSSKKAALKKAMDFVRTETDGKVSDGLMKRYYDLVIKADKTYTDESAMMNAEGEAKIYSAAFTTYNKAANIYKEATDYISIKDIIDSIKTITSDIMNGSVILSETDGSINATEAIKNLFADTEAMKIATQKLEALYQEGTIIKDTITQEDITAVTTAINAVKNDILKTAYTTKLETVKTANKLILDAQEGLAQCFTDDTQTVLREQVLNAAYTETGNAFLNQIESEKLEAVQNSDLISAELKEAFRTKLQKAQELWNAEVMNKVKELLASKEGNTGSDYVIEDNVVTSLVVKDQVNDANVAECIKRAESMYELNKAAIVTDKTQTKALITAIQTVLQNRQEAQEMINALVIRRTDGSIKELVKENGVVTLTLDMIYAKDADGAIKIKALEKLKLGNRIHSQGLHDILQKEVETDIQNLLKKDTTEYVKTLFSDYDDPTYETIKDETTKQNIKDIEARCIATILDYKTNPDNVLANKIKKAYTELAKRILAQAATAEEELGKIAEVTYNTEKTQITAVAVHDNATVKQVSDVITGVNAIDTYEAGTTDETELAVNAKKEMLQNGLGMIKEKYHTLVETEVNDIYQKITTTNNYEGIEARILDAKKAVSNMFDSEATKKAVCSMKISASDLLYQISLINQNEEDTLLQKMAEIEILVTTFTNAHTTTAGYTDCISNINKSVKDKKDAWNIYLVKTYVDSLFGRTAEDKVDYAALAKHVTYIEIETAKNKVAAMYDSPEKTSAEEHVTNAMKLLIGQQTDQENLETAKTKIEALFTDASKTELDSTVTQDMIRGLEGFLNEISIENEVKTTCKANLRTAKILWNTSIKIQIDHLFKDITLPVKDLVLADGVTKEQVITVLKAWSTMFNITDAAEGDITQDSEMSRITKAVELSGVQMPESQVAFFANLR